MRKVTSKSLVLFVLVIWAVVSLFPLAWMIYASFVPGKANQFTLSFSNFGLASYRELIRAGEVPRWLVNSIVVAGAITLGQIVMNSMAGFALARHRFPGRRILFWSFVATMMIPPQITVIPLYLLLSRWGLIDSLWAVILPSLVGPFGIFMIKQYLQNLPRDIEDAAVVDGCSAFGVYWRIILPLCKPALAVMAVLVFVWEWNVFFWPLIVLNSSDNYTLTVGLKTLQDIHVMDRGLLMAGATLSAVPVIGIFLVFQRLIVRGVAMGAVKM